MRMLSRFLSVIMLVLLISVPALALEEGFVKLTSMSEFDMVVVNEKGEKEVKRVDAAKAKIVPGDEVIFTTVYENVGKEPVTAAVINNPVPEHTVYVDKSAEGKGTRIEFSIDGGKTFGLPKTLMVAGKDGKAKQAQASDYTHIRWTVEKAVAPGAKGSVSFKARVK
ncbi:MAG: hypothetical protein A3J24_13180 [Deltaproteobacteria bacterium RIFCSPLOWO2_02_FULL_53_8]|nr:MAG: hypothetical protein A3J24_13180 [Deltaproteobacteria bacterium RIFCSPLOWO2_02_FULL_53_8]